MENFDIDSLLEDEIGRHITGLTLEELKQFVLHTYRIYGSTNKLNEANQIIDVMLAMLKKRKQITENGSQAFVEIMIVAALLHHLFYDGTLASIFEAREKLTSIAQVCNVPENGYNAVFQAIECQLGDDMPVVSCRPIPSTPNELFAWAIWFVCELHGGKEMPKL